MEVPIDWAAFADIADDDARYNALDAAINSPEGQREMAAMLAVHRAESDEELGRTPPGPFEKALQDNHDLILRVQARRGAHR